MEQETLDDSGLVRRSYGLTVKSIDEQARSIEVVASTPAIDSYGEIVAQNWRLERYNANPVVLFAHRSRELPIGRSEDTRVGSDGNLQSRFFFSSAKANPLADQVWNSILEKTLRGVSVGFNPADVRFEKRDGVEVYVLDNNELFEISMTPVPANPFGLVKDVDRGLWVPRDPKWFVDMKSRAAERAKAGMVPSRNERATMDIELLKKELESKASELATALKAVGERDERVKALELEIRGLLSRAEAAEKALKEQTERANKLDGEAIASDVQKLLGKKIVPAQKDEFIELRTSMGREKFEAFVSKFPDLNLTTDVIDPEATPTENTATKSGAKPRKLLAKANEAARAAGAH